MIEGMIKILESAFEYPITISGNSSRHGKINKSNGKNVLVVMKLGNDIKNLEK